MKLTRLNRFFYSFLFLLLCSFLPTSVFAHYHVAGADLTYTCLGNNQYQVKVTLIIDCTKSTAPDSIDISYSSKIIGFSQNIDIAKVTGSGEKADMYCAAAKTRCQGGNLPGFEKYDYITKVTLPQKSSDWVFSCGGGSRNASSNVQTGGHLYIEAELDNSNVPCHDSPTFTNAPIALFCVRQNSCYNHGTIAPVGDSLSYQFITPKINASDSIKYITGLSATQPAFSNPAVSIDKKNGDFCLTPTAQQTSNMAIKVIEWRNGKQIGSVIRDVRLNIIACFANDNPYVTGINGTGSFKDTICSEDKLTFDIPSNDKDSGQKVTMTWNNGIAGAQFNVSSGNHPTGTFTWQSSKSDANSTQCFTVKVQDDHCPLTGFHIYAFCIYIPPEVKLVGDTICEGDSIVLKAVGVSSDGQYKWSPGNETSQSITVSPKKDTQYIVNYTDPTGCQSSDTAKVIVHPLPIAAFTMNPDPSNKAVDIEYKNNSQGGTVWRWDFGDGSSSNKENPLHQYKDTGSYVVSLVVENKNGCRDSISELLRIDSKYAMFIPNIFTPNEDGLNDYFTITGQGIKKLNISIFNRWGKVVFKSQDIDFKWDGTYNGQEVSAGEYMYNIVVEDENRKHHKYSAHLTLLR